jgi:cytochrome b561
MPWPCTSIIMALRVFDSHHHAAKHMTAQAKRNYFMNEATYFHIYSLFLFLLYLGLIMSSWDNKKLIRTLRGVAFQ